jgi:hypothetical protein
MNFSSTGTFVSDTEEGFLHLAAVYSLGTGHAAEGVVVYTGSMVLTATDGDKVYATVRAELEDTPVYKAGANLLGSHCHLLQREYG